MRTKALLIAAAVTFGGAIHAQSLSPDDIARMLDDQRPVVNPYAALLNDPDPARGIGAMKIMMESGDPELVRLALEHGLLSANPEVQLAALKGYLRTRPRLLVTIDGTAGISSSLSAFARRMDATFAEDGRIFYRWQLGSLAAMTMMRTAPLTGPETSVLSPSISTVFS